MSDASQVNNLIKNQQRKVNGAIKDILKMKATQSRYPAMSRAEKRVTEFHNDRLNQEQSLQRDCKKAERLARRVGQVLERLRKEFNSIKNHLGNYNFANTVGVDSTCGGDCADDLSSDIGTRQAWKRELENMLTMVWHYIDAQHLGDFAIGHQPVVASDNTCTSEPTITNCCPKVYRPYFHYYTPDGDCLALPSEVGSHSGDSSAVTPSGNYNDVATRGCVLGYKAVSTVNPTAENKSTPASHKHFQVTNKDHEIRQLWKLLVGSTGGQTVDSDAWFSFLFANTDKATYDSVKESVEKLFLPEEMLNALDRADPAVETSVYDDLATGGAFNTATMTTLPSSIDSNSEQTAIDAKARLTAALAHAPTICNIEDESDLQFIFKLITCVMNSVRTCQINNDHEQQVIEYVNEVSECNEAFHQDVFSDLTAIDESELDQRYAVGKAMAQDLDGLYRENCVSKQTFFNDVTLSGNCW